MNNEFLPQKGDYRNLRVYQLGNCIETRSAETCANIAITMLHQFDVMICHLIETQKQRFLQEGGIKEQMYRARVQQRGEWSARSTQGAQSDQSSQSSRSSQSSQSTQNR